MTDILDHSSMEIVGIVSDLAQVLLSPVFNAGENLQRSSCIDLTVFLLSSGVNAPATKIKPC